VSVPVPVPGNSQTTCDDRLKAGPLRGEKASPRVLVGTALGFKKKIQTLIHFFM